MCSNDEWSMTAHENGIALLMQALSECSGIDLISEAAEDVFVNDI